MAPFSRILFIERTPTHSMHGVTCAAVLARAQEAKLTVAGYVGSGPRSLCDDALTEDQSRMCRWWTQRVDDLRGVGRLHDVPTETALLGGDFQSAINRQVGEGGHDLVVLVREPVRNAWPLRPPWADRLILRETEASVLFLSPRQSSDFSVVLSGIDVTTEPARELGARLASITVEIARDFGGEAEFVHAWSLVGETVLASPTRGVSPARLAQLRDEERSRRLDQIAELIPEADDIPVRITTPHGAVGRALEHRAIEAGADIIVLGRPTVSLIGSLVLGTPPEYLLGRIPAAILVVAPDAGSVEPAQAPGERALETAS